MHIDAGDTAQGPRSQQPSPSEYVVSDQHQNGVHRFSEQLPAHARPAAYQEVVFAEGMARSAEQPMPGFIPLCQTLMKFSRPHTMLGTFVSVTSVSIMALVSSYPA